MRQVPHFLLIGNGCLAKHFRHYFSQLNLPYATWHRHESNQLLKEKLTKATHVLLLISDRAIEPFIKSYLIDTALSHKNILEKSHIILHFSGSLVSDVAFGVHPLMTFSQELYDFQQYRLIPFMIDHDAPDFHELLPGVPNLHLRLHKTLKPKYHAMCVLSANFTCMLWQKFFDYLERELDVPVEIIYPYLSQQLYNLLKDPKSALTGPFVRDDQTTIQNNIAALSNDPFQSVYQSFLSCYQQLKGVS